MKRKLTKITAFGMLAGTAAMVSACGMLNVQAVYGPPPDTEQVNPAPAPAATAGEILDGIIELQGVYGPPQELPGTISSEDLERTLDEILGSQYLYGPPALVDGTSISGYFKPETYDYVPEILPDPFSSK